MLENLERRRFIGRRIKERRKQLGMSQKELAERIGVNQSTVNRYERGMIENDKIMILNSLSEALNVTVGWLTGETDQIASEISDQTDRAIRDAFQEISSMFPLNLSEQENMYSKELLLILLKEFKEFCKSFEFATGQYSVVNEQTGFITSLEGMDLTPDEFNAVMFRREITHTISAFIELEDILSGYARQPKVARNRLHRMLSFYD